MQPQANATVAPPVAQIPNNADAIHAAEKAMADKINNEPAKTADPQSIELKTADAPAAPAQDPASKRLAFLAKKERETIQMRKQVNQQAQQMRTLQSQLQEAMAKQQAFMSQFQTNPDEALASIGVTYDKWTEARLTKKPIDTTTQQIQSVKQELAATQQAYLRDQQLAAQQAVQAQQATLMQAVEVYKSDIADFVGTKPEYSDLNDEDGKNDMFQLADLWAEKTGKVLDLKEAADMVLAQRYEDIEQRVERSAALQARLAGKIKPAAPATPAAPKADPAVFQPRGTTLTNRMVGSSSGDEPQGIPSESEAIRRALAKLQRPV